MIGEKRKENPRLERVFPLLSFPFLKFILSDLKTSHILYCDVPTECHCGLGCKLSGTSSQREPSSGVEGWKPTPAAWELVHMALGGVKS